MEDTLQISHTPLHGKRCHTMHSLASRVSLDCLSVHLDAFVRTIVLHRAPRSVPHTKKTLKHSVLQVTHYNGSLMCVCHSFWGGLAVSCTVAVE